MGTQQRLTHFRARGPFLEALRCIIPSESCTVIVRPKQRKKKKVAESCPTLCDPTDCKPTRLPHPWNFPGKSTGVGCHFLLQGIFPAQGLNPHLLVSYVSCIGRQIFFFLPIVPSGKPLNFISSFLNWLLFLLESNCSIVVATTIILFIFLTYIILKNVLEIFLKK